MELSWKAVVLVALCLTAIWVCEWHRDGQVTYVAVGLTSIVALVAIGVLSAATVEKIMLAIVNHYITQMDAKMDKLVAAHAAETAAAILAASEKPGKKGKKE